MKMKTPPSQRPHRVQAQPPPLDKARIAEAVHRAVCVVTDSDGCNKCLYYAHCGWGLLYFLGIATYIQAGDHDILIDPANRTAASTEGGGVDSGDFNCWLIRPLQAHRPGIYRGKAEYIDFSSRHFKVYLPSGHTWAREYPPDYLWTEDPSHWARYEVIHEQTKFAADVSNIGRDLVKHLVWTAINLYTATRANL